MSILSFLLQAPVDPSVTSSDKLSSDALPNGKPYFNEFEQKALVLKILDL
jgi:hypothetical protein